MESECLLCSRPSNDATTTWSTPSDNPLRGSSATAPSASAIQTLCKVLALPLDSYDLSDFGQQCITYCSACTQVLAQLHSCVQQLEQLEVKISEFKAEILKQLFNTQQQRHEHERPGRSTRSAAAETETALLRLRNKIVDDIQANNSFRSTGTGSGSWDDRKQTCAETPRPNASSQQSTSQFSQNSSENQSQTQSTSSSEIVMVDTIRTEIDPAALDLDPEHDPLALATNSNPEPAEIQGHFAWEEIDLKVNVTPGEPEIPHYAEPRGVFHVVVEEVELKFPKDDDHDCAQDEHVAAAATTVTTPPLSNSVPETATMKTLTTLTSQDLRGPPFRCPFPDCSRSYGAWQNLEDHFHLHHRGERRHVCPICKKDYGSLGELSRHGRTHRNPFKCDFGDCCFTFPTNSLLIGHKSEHFRQNSNSNADANANATRHFLEPGFHTVELQEQVELKFCPEDVVVATMTTTEEITSGPSPEVISGNEGATVCTRCSQSFDDLEEFVEHTRTQHFPTRCPVRGCKYPVEPGTLELHIRTHQGERPFRCNVCQSSQLTPGALSQHIKFQHTHVDGHVFKCGSRGCPAVFSTGSQLTMHRRKVHVGPAKKLAALELKLLRKRELESRWIKCSFPNCHRSFRGPTALQAHLTTHKGEKPFGCEICKKKFATEAKKKLHARVHSFKFKCYVRDCWATFPTSGRLNRHRSKEHE